MEKQGGGARRDFLGTAVGTAAGLTILGATAKGQGKVFKVGLIGCGGRGGGAVRNCIEAGKTLNVEVRVAALADAMKDRAQGCQAGLKKDGHEVPDDRCFVGFDAYKKLCATDVDIVLQCTAPSFRPLHIAAAVEAGKHIFMEKPVAVDAPGCRRMYAVGEAAKKKGLSVVAGTCLRHAAGYAATHKVVAEDQAIGKIVGGAIWYCTGSLGQRERDANWTDAEYLVRNWVNFCCMSGDHIVEQYVHTLDMLNWHLGAHPVAAVGFGGRHRRKTGDQYDFFSNDLEYPGGVHLHGCCRQIKGCWSRANEGEIRGEKGSCTFGGRGVVRDAEGKPLPLPEYKWHSNMYVQEHIVLLDSLLKNQPVNDTQDVTDSTLACVLSRISAYTGRRITWDELTKPGGKSEWYDYACKPTAEDFESGEVKAPPDDVVPVAGSGDAPPKRRPQPRPDDKKAPKKA